jgi:hypothetical protein
MLTDADLRPVRQTMIGFGPFQFAGLQLVSEERAMAVNDRLQHLADRGVPLLRATGSQHLVLAVAE